MSMTSGVLRNCLVFVGLGLMMVGRPGLSNASVSSTVKIVSPPARTTVSGMVNITTQAIESAALVKIFIDGRLQSSTVSSLAWDSSRVHDGWHVIHVQAFSSTHRLLGASWASVRVANTERSRRRPAPTPTPSGPNPSPAPPAPTSTPTPRAGCSDHYIDSTGMSVPVGAGCAPAFPDLNSPVNPVDYGADPSGGNDSTSGFQAAVNASDVLVPAGTYLINGEISLPSNRNFQCQPGAVLYTPVLNSNETGLILLDSVSGGSIAGCTFKGGNTSVPPDQGPVSNGETGNNLLEMAQASGWLIEGNTFAGAYGDGAIHVTYAGDTPNIGSADNTFQYNTFLNNATNGFAIVSGTNNVATNNLFINCGTDIESNASDYQVTNNIITHNEIENTVTPQAYGPLLNCAGNSFSDYSSNTCEYGYVSGAGSFVDNRTGPRFLGNQCVDGCQVLHGSNPY